MLANVEAGAHPIRAMTTATPTHRTAMAHHLHLFAGHPEVLRRYAEVTPRVRLYRLTPGAELAALPLSDDVHDALHKAYGTGEWAETVRLTTADMGFAAETSRRGPLAYLETDYFGGTGLQAAAAWVGGALALRPIQMAREQGQGRSSATWPINAALRLLGLVARPGLDAFDTFGLGRFRSVETIEVGAAPVRFR